MTVNVSNVAIREVSVTVPRHEALTPHIRIMNVREFLAETAQPRTPNAETIEVLRQTERGEDIIWFNSLAALIEDCEAYAESPDD